MNTKIVRISLPLDRSNQHFTKGCKLLENTQFVPSGRSAEIVVLDEPDNMKKWWNEYRSRGAAKRKILILCKNESHREEIEDFIVINKMLNFTAVSKATLSEELAQACVAVMQEEQKEEQVAQAA